MTWPLQSISTDSPNEVYATRYLLRTVEALVTDNSLRGQREDAPHKELPHTHFDWSQQKPSPNVPSQGNIPEESQKPS